MENITYRLSDFEGPLDLLLNLIEKNKMDILNISISLICDQYLEFLEKAEDMDMEIATEFLKMASQLILPKRLATNMMRFILMNIKIQTLCMMQSSIPFQKATDLWLVT
jgi:hypothetical protein